MEPEEIQKIKAKEEDKLAKKRSYSNLQRNRVAQKALDHSWSELLLRTNRVKGIPKPKKP